MQCKARAFVLLASGMMSKVRLNKGLRAHLFYWGRGVCPCLKPDGMDGLAKVAEQQVPYPFFLHLGTLNL